MLNLTKPNNLSILLTPFEKKRVYGKRSSYINEGSLVGRKEVSLNVISSLGPIEEGVNRWLGFQAPLQFAEVDCIWLPDLFWRGRQS
jgi:hypothetical protein